MVNEGDVVWLRSAARSCEADYKQPIKMSTPKMTVASIDGTNAECVWWDGNEYHADTFPTCVLDIIHKKD